MLQIADRVKETTTTTGTGALTLAGAVTGFRAFSSVCADQDTLWYALQAVDANGIPTGAWEVGIGTYTASGNTLARTTVLSSSNSNAAVNLAAGTKQVWIGQPAGRVALPTFGEPDVAPKLSDFAWVNQGSAVAAQRDGYISMYNPSTAAENNMLLMAAPAAPYSFTARMSGTVALAYQGHGLCVYDSASGNSVTHGSTGGVFRVSSWSSPTTFANALLAGGNPIIPEWLRVRNDGTSLFYDISSDGYSWINAYTAALTANMAHAPTHIGVYIHHESNAPAQGALHSWKVG